MWNVGTEQETWRGSWDCDSRFEESYIEINPNNARLQGKAGSVSLPWHYLTNRACPLKPFKYKQEEGVRGCKRPLYGWCFWGSLLSSLAYFYSWNTSSFLLKNKPTNQVSSTEMELHLFPLLPLPRGPTSHSTSTPSISHPTLKLIASFSSLLLLHTYTGRSMYVCICMHR